MHALLRKLLVQCVSISTTEITHLPPGGRFTTKVPLFAILLSKLPPLFTSVAQNSNTSPVIYNHKANLFVPSEVDLMNDLRL